jgi:Domain of unknown function (DUF1854)
MSEPFDLALDDQGRLVLKRPGKDDVVDVRLRRAFPWSRPGTFLSLRDSEGKELMLLEDIEPLDVGRRTIIENWLAGASFVPRIVGVDDVDVRFGYQQWKVRTDRGPAEFRVQEREDIRFLPDGRFRIKDADGTVYEMVSLNQLDEPSRRAVEALI